MFNAFFNYISNDVVLTQTNPKSLNLFGWGYFFVNLQFWFPVWVIFLLDRDISLFEIIVADVVFNVAIILLEFPLGVISDRIGRKRTIILGTFLGAATYASMIFITNFLILLVVWIFWAAYLATMSGTDTAYIYEVLTSKGSADRAKVVFGRFTAVSNAAFLISHFLAGFLYSIDSNLPIAINAGFTILAIVFFLIIPEIQEEKTPEIKSGLRTVLKMNQENRTLGGFTMLHGFMLAFTWSTTILFQPFLQELGLEISNFGLVFASFTLAGIVGGVITGPLEKIVGEQAHYLSSILLIVFSMGMIWGLPGNSAIIGIILMRLSYSIFVPNIIEIINRQVTNDIRASILSFANLGGSIGLIILRPLLVYLTDIFSIRIGFLIWFIVGLVFFVLVVVINYTYLTRKTK